MELSAPKIDALPTQDNDARVIAFFNDALKQNNYQISITILKPGEKILEHHVITKNFPFADMFPSHKQVENNLLKIREHNLGQQP